MSTATVNMNTSTLLPVQRARPVNWNYKRSATKIFRKPLSGYYGKFPLSMTLNVKGPPASMSKSKSTVLCPQATQLVAESNFTGTPAFNIPTDIRHERAQETARGLESLPIKAVLSKRKQVPGRYFPKATLSKEQRERAESAKETKDRTPKPDRNPSLVHVDWNRDANGRRSITPKRPRVSTGVPFRHSSSRCRTPSDYRIVKNKSRLDQDSLFFAISFHNGTPRFVNQPSELHSDYYTIEKVAYNPRHVTFPSGDKGDFSGILSGMGKTLHDRYLIPNEHENPQTTN